ncbi:ABC transporter ATP-binding protein [Bacillus atrophaeus]|uniref:Bacitracin ABC transporter, ATP-binding protein n=3 Tax=Bacillus atrophaeus TaxID=1452 RepID=A0ABN3ZM25_BACA1|nr:ABC transporter ATP-binding protein [Bacillus atrophaeus]AMR64244.1 bacitracin ABC transporter ATP-binding protein [Bacillus subtilis subsp. globigii]ADP34902.1 bacitracin ABC transporter, ATP-binding protein [Bacillus atrophaeus 1942]AIK46042.1 ABC transporter family protein [Bacillus atrophaeus subsp. globigii]EIM09805.1 bacitracin ABC transporter ATP-binding protein [Bacillus atrophaeus C89]KFK81064.1 ABC transporter family protein [Bacillus atrophaeus]
MTYTVNINGLTKTFQGKEVVSNVNMHIRKGEIYGFLGPNGAGKTTVMKMLTSLVKPTGGEIEILGHKLTNTSYKVLGRIGSMIEYPIFYEKLTAQENLELHCEYMGYHDKNSIQEVLGMVNLKNIEDKAVKTFSLGMKQRLGIARAIITKPELLILDEPINGLDPVGIKEIRHLFQVLSKEYGMTLLISSHMLSEIEQIADTIGVIRDGRLLEEVSMDKIRGQNTEYIELVTTNRTKACFVLENELGITNFKILNEKTVRIYDSDASQAAISKALILNDIDIESINKKYTSLEDYFLSLINGDSISA